MFSYIRIEVVSLKFRIFKVLTDYTLNDFGSLRKLLLWVFMLLSCSVTFAQGQEVYIEVLGSEVDLEALRIIDRSEGERTWYQLEMELDRVPGQPVQSTTSLFLEEGEYRIDFIGVEDLENTYWQMLDASGAILFQESCINNHFRHEGGAGYRMPVWNNPDGTIETCGGDFYDQGGLGGGYANNITRVTTFCPGNPGECIEVTFTSFLLESSNNDWLRIYDGPTTAATLINQYTGNVSPGTITATEGCLTFEFSSNLTVNAPGWEATISCVTCAEPPTGINTDNGCPAVNAGPDIALPTCFTPCTPQDVTASFFDTGETTSYELTSIPYDPVYPYNLGTIFGTTGTDHDRWSDVISLPFTFCFFGNTYTDLVVGSNGVLSFDLSYANGVCPGTIAGPIPDQARPLNSIFGVYSDLEPTACGQPRYAILGAAPCRAFIVSYDNVCMFGCNTVQSTSQIVFYETTNVIEIYIDYKPICTNANFGKSIMGIQNADGTIAYSSSSPNRNGVSLWLGNQEGWRFTPNGASVVTVNWYDQLNGFIGSGATVAVCPEEPTQTFVAEAVYATCDGNVVTVSDDVIIACSQILLPVEWLSFQAKLSSDQTVLCDWVTGSEENNAYFTIERSVDNEEWHEIGVLPGAGNSIESNAYSFVDRQPLAGYSYYRIRQSDFNGQSSYSEVRSVYNESNALSVYPNPGNGQFKVTGAGNAQLMVVDNTGRSVPFNWDGNVLTLEQALPGHYLVKEVVHGSEVQVIRVVVQE